MYLDAMHSRVVRTNGLVSESADLVNLRGSAAKDPQSNALPYRVLNFRVAGASSCIACPAGSYSSFSGTQSIVQDDLCLSHRLPSCEYSYGMQVQVHMSIHTHGI